MPCTTITLVDSQEQVRTIVAALHGAGFATGDISVVFPHRRLGEGDAIRPDDLEQANVQSGEGAAIGVVAGGAVGTALAWLTGAGLITIPGIGPLLAAGPILTIFTGMGIGASLGGMAGALAGMGVSQIDAKRYASSISDGRILIAVRTDDASRVPEVEEIMRHSHGEDVAHFTWPATQAKAATGG